jgi:hypothetical protein
MCRNCCRLMPPWLQVVSTVNPLTYQVDALRGAVAGRTRQLRP